MTEIRRTYFV